MPLNKSKRHPRLSPARVRSIMETAGITVPQLAEAYGGTRNWVWQVLAGNVLCPYPFALWLADTLGVHLMAIVENVQPMIYPEDPRFLLLASATRHYLAGNPPIHRRDDATLSAVRLTGYLRFQGITVANFAETYDISARHVSRVSRGLDQADLSLAVAAMVEFEESLDDHPIDQIGTNAYFAYLQLPEGVRRTLAGLSQQGANAQRQIDVLCGYYAAVEAS